MVTPPHELPGRLWSWVLDAASGAAADFEAIGEALVTWADGRKPEELEALLDALREVAAYPVSLHVLEAAWNAEVPLDLLGRVAQDWVGTVLHGIGDRAGALVVAAHLQTRALELGPALAGDLGDLYLSWGLYEPADPLVRAAASAHPGDLALRFNLGVVQKLAGEWADAAESFEAVLRHHDDQAAHWNLGVVRTALADWVGARAAWRALGFPMPPGDLDIASPGEPTAVRLGVEVLWGVRLCPARVELRTLPCRTDAANVGDVLLVDGVSTGNVRYPDGSEGPILPVLTALLHRGAQTWTAPGAPARVAAVAEQLDAEGWPVADWSALVGTGCLAIAALPPRSAAEVTARLSEIEGIGAPKPWEPPA